MLNIIISWLLFSRSLDQRQAEAATYNRGIFVSDYIESAYQGII